MVPDPSLPAQSSSRLFLFSFLRQMKRRRERKKNSREIQASEPLTHDWPLYVLSRVAHLSHSLTKKWADYDGITKYSILSQSVFSNFFSLSLHFQLSLSCPSTRSPLFSRLLYFPQEHVMYSLLSSREGAEIFTGKNCCSKIEEARKYENKLKEVQFRQ